MGDQHCHTPESIRTREDLASALADLRESAGLTVRQLAQKSGVPQGTIGSWSAGHHVPTKANEPMLRKMLGACGVTDFTEQTAWLHAVERVRATAGRRTAASEPPYLGLRSFSESDAQRFFGRAELTELLRTQVMAAMGNQGADRVLVVIGASGSGKSSLLRAGLIPALRHERLDVCLVLPGRHPLESLWAVPHSTDVIVVDQFEEAWTLCPDEIERRGFLDAITGEDSDPIIVLGLRADFFAAAAAEPGLLAALNERSTVVGPLTASALRHVIVEPARSAGCDVAPEMVNLLLTELRPHGTEYAHDVGALPLLSHALLETWRRAARNTLTVADYQAVGGIGGAIEQRAEQLFGQLTEHHQHIARKLFLRLVNLDDQTHTRRRVRRSELLFDEDAVDMVLDQFAHSRLLTVEAQTVSISHEALIGAWERLTDWMNADREGLILHRRLTLAAQNWDDSGRDPSALLGATRLPPILEWAECGDHDHELNVLEREFLTASVDHNQRVRDGERRRRRRLQQMVAALAVLLVVAVTAALLAIASRASARLARDEAVSRQVAGAAIRLRDTDPALAAQLALAAYRINPTIEARSAVLDASAVHTPVRLTGPPGNTLVTPGPGDALLVWAADGTTSLLRTSDGKPHLTTTPLPTMASLIAMALSPDTGLLARASDSTIELWNVGNWDTPTLLGAIPAQAIKSLAFGPDGRTVVAGTDGPEIRRWQIDDPSRPTELAPLHLPGGQTIVAVDVTGKRLAAGGKFRSLRVWNIAGPEATLLLDLPPDGPLDTIQAVQFSPNGSMLAIGTRSSQVQRWRFNDTTPPTQLPTLGGFTSYVNDLAFSPDGNRLAAASSDNSIRIWTLADDTLELSLPNPAVVGSVRFAGNATVVSAGVDGTTRLWPLPAVTLSGARAKIEFMAFNGAGTTLLVGPGRGETRSYLWDLTNPRTPQPIQPLDIPHDDTPTGAVAISPNGTLAAVGTTSGQVYLWDISTRSLPRYITAIQAVPSLVATLLFTADGTKLIAGSQDHPVITIWNLTNPVSPQRLSLLDTGHSRPRDIAIDQSATLLAAGTNADLVQLWDIGDPANPRNLLSLDDFDGTVNRIAISPDGAVLAASGHEPTVHLFDVRDPRNPRPVAQLIGPVEPAYSLAFSPNGRTLARSGNGGIWLWDTSTPNQPHVLANLTADQGRVNDAKFGRDGQFLTGAGENRIVHLWTTDPDKVADDICVSGSTTLTATEWERHIPDYPSRSLCPT
ncbi:helix-turn-helix domain-containing protein [Nocardia sp. NPDC058658]|uniref:nSTAND1 domain-containing NTPase n=1 Tax=Nocardia sp. NPDC058658 TaxID=3346580 RepID=UPI0036617B47